MSIHSNHQPIQTLNQRTTSILTSSLAFPSILIILQSLIQISLNSNPTTITSSLNTSSSHPHLRIDHDGIGLNKASIYHILSSPHSRLDSKKTKNDDDDDHHLGYQLGSLELQFFKSLIHLATVDVCSRTKGSDETHQIIFKDAQPIFSGPAKTSRRHQSGCTVNVRDLFHNLPVRSKHLNSDHQQEFLKCKRSIELFSILYPNVKFKLLDLEHELKSSTRNGLVQSEFKEVGLLIQRTHHSILTFGKLFGQSLIKDGYIVENQQFEKFNVEGFLGKETHLNKSGQLIFLNGQVIPNTSPIYQRLSRSMTLSNNLLNPASSLQSFKKSTATLKSLGKSHVWLLIFTSQDQITNPHLGLFHEPLSSRIEESLSKICESLCQRYIFQGNLISKPNLSEDRLTVVSSDRTSDHQISKTTNLERYSSKFGVKRPRADEGFSFNKKSKPSTSYLSPNSDWDNQRSRPSFEKGVIDRFKFSKKGSNLYPPKEETHIKDQQSSTRPQTRIEHPRVSVKRLVSIENEKREKEEDGRQSQWITRSLDDYRDPVFGRKKPLTTTFLKPEKIKSLNLTYHQDDLKSNLSKNPFIGKSKDQKTVIDLNGLKDPRKFKLIGQVDRKLIVVYFNQTRTLVVFDQHAIDERIRVERFLKGFIQPELMVIEMIGRPYKEGKGVGFEVEEVEFEGFMRWEKRFKRYGFVYEFGEAKEKVWLKGLPGLIFKRLEKDKFKGIGELMRLCLRFFETHPEEKEWDRNRNGKDWMNGMKFLPDVLIEMMNSKACRGSIMFGDRLKDIECLELLNGLRETRNPFLCAHGRLNCQPILSLMDSEHQKKEVKEGKLQRDEKEEGDEYFDEFLTQRFRFDLNWFMKP